MDSLQVDGINKELAKFELIGGILGVAVVDENGLTIISRLQRSIDERKFGAMAATIQGAMETAVIPLKEDLLNLTIEYENSQIIIMSFNTKIVLVILIEMEVDLGFILLEMEEILKNINRIIEG